MDAATSNTTPADPRPPRHRARYWGLALLVVLAALVAAVALIDWANLARPYAERIASQKTGRTVRIGDIRLRWQHPLRIEVRDVSVSNPPWAANPVFFDTKLAVFEFRVRPLLFRRELVVPYAELDAPRLFLEQQGERRTWLIGTGEKGGEPIQPVIARAVVRDGQINYLEQSSKTDVRIAFETQAAGSAPAGSNAGGAAASAAAGRLSTPETGDRLRVRATGQYRGEKLDAQATGGSILRLRDDSQPYPISVDGRLGHTSVKAAGQIVELVGFKAFNVDLDVSGHSLGDVGDAFDVAIPESPPYRLRGHLTRREGVWLVERLAGKVGDSDLGGQVQFDPRTTARPRPLLTATLVSQKLDFNDMGPLLGLPPSTAPGQTASPAQRREAEQMRAKDQALPGKPFDTSKWRKFDANVSFEGKKVLHAPSVPALDALAAQFTLDDGVVKIAPAKLGVAGGQVTAQVTLNGRAQPLQGALQAQFAGLKLDRLFPTVEKMRSSLGTIYGQVDLKSSGQSVKALMGDADGSVHLAMAGGRISNMLVELAGLDGGEVIKYFVRGDREIRIRCGMVDLAIQDGVATTRTLLVDTTDSNVLGSGQINFSNEQLGITFNVRPKDASILAFRAPIHLTGSLRKPKIAPDTATLATKGLAALALGALNPLLALLPTIETGPGEDADCKQLVAEAPKFTEQGATRAARRNESKLPPDTRKADPAPAQAGSQASPAADNAARAATAARGGANPNYPN